MTDVETVRTICEAFGGGDVAAIPDQLDDTVEWATTAPVPDAPWIPARRGNEEIAGFFDSMAPQRGM